MTGATGFIGSHLIKKLINEKHDVTILVRKSSDLWRISPYLDDVVVEYGSIHNYGQVKKSMMQSSPEVIYHLAWQGILRNDRDNISQLDNLCSSINILKTAIELNNNPAFIGVGSQAEKGINDYLTNDELALHSTYGVSKYCFSILGKKLCHMNNIRFIWFRLFATYGSKDNPQWLIPYVILSLLEGKKPLLTSGFQKRDYLYVSDVVDALFLSAVNEKISGSFELGSGISVDIRTIAESIRNIIDPNLPLGFSELKSSALEQKNLVANIAEYQKVSGWAPKVSLDEGLRKTICWYKENMTRYPL